MNFKATILLIWSIVLFVPSLTNFSIGQGFNIGQDLSGIDLSGQDLRDQDLRNLNLTGANLSRTNLKEANLERADLTTLHK